MLTCSHPRCADVDVSTAGIGAPVVSTIEDIGSVALSLVAIVVPVLVLVVLVAMVAGFWALIRHRRRRKGEIRYRQRSAGA